MGNNDRILRLNEKHIQELNRENLREIKIKCHSDHRKNRYEPVEKSKNNSIEFL